MDFAYYGNADSVPLCDNVASVDIKGYWLCFDCAEALDVLGVIGYFIRGGDVS